MGPFPHQAPKAVISPHNSAGSDGFAFVELAHPEPQRLRELFAQMGFAPTARHRTRAVELWQQGDITFVLNAEPGTHAAAFLAAHGPCAPAMGWRVADAAHAFAHAVARGAEPYTGPGRPLDLPAIRGIGGSPICFTGRCGAADPSDAEFDQVAPPRPERVGLQCLDHLTHSVRRGNMDRWVRFYGDPFGFREIRFFDIEGKQTGLDGRAPTSPCGRIRIPINEDRGDTGQIAECLRRYNGEGVLDGGETRILLLIFSRTAIGPIFFEVIQRKGDAGFGEGNFRALLEPIGQDQIECGVLPAG